MMMILLFYVSFSSVCHIKIMQGDNERLCSEVLYRHKMNYIYIPIYTNIYIYIYIYIYTTTSL